MGRKPEPKPSALRRFFEDSPSEQARKQAKKSLQLKVRVSPQDRDSIKLAAGAEGMTVTDYLLALHRAHQKGKAIRAKLG